MWKISEINYRNYFKNLKQKSLQSISKELLTQIKSSCKNSSSNNFPRGNKILNRTQTEVDLCQDLTGLSDFHCWQIMYCIWRWLTQCPSFLHRLPWIVILKQKATMGLIFLPEKKCIIKNLLIIINYLWQCLQHIRNSWQCISVRY